MKNIARLALTLTVAALALLKPMAHADPSFAGSSVTYTYHDSDGTGSLTIQDLGPRPWSTPDQPSRHIAVTLSQNGHTATGDGTAWLYVIGGLDVRNVFFSLSDNGGVTRYHFQGWIDYTYHTGYGSYKLGGTSDQFAQNWWVD